ncbi:CHRD domain-containing protein [Nocardioides sp.]|uniref:CHRD domain-containing protein n=1 Tax=Nocardioides sp. TaxID=35761 RepID=UPI00286C0C1E|nr:CHRD domain-containing protein [Nocardioides sp.]
MTIHQRSLRPWVTLALSTCVAVSLALPAPASGDVAAGSGHPRRAAVELTTTLRPSGDPDGVGRARVTLNRARARVCADVTWRRIQSPDSAHLHRRSDSQVVVDLSTAVTGGARCTTGVRRSLIRAIAAHPRRYYLNVHNATYPAGAIEGTLRRS